jgi:hypothetical protein
VNEEPAVAPDPAAVSPAVGVAGEQGLEALGEARLAGAVAADDEGEVEGGLRADAAEAFDRDGFQEGDSGGGGRGRPLVLGLGVGVEALQDEVAEGGVGHYLFYYPFLGVVPLLDHLAPGP